MFNGLILAALCLGIITFLLLWNKPVILIYLVLLLCLTGNAFTTQLGIPSMVLYIGDIVTVYLFAWAVIMELKRNKTEYSIVIQLIIIVIMFSLSLMTFLLGSYSIADYIFGVLKTMRYFMLFFASVVFLDEKDVYRLFNLFIVFVGLNMLLSSIQYFIQGIRWDYNGGFFGTEVGGNGQMNLFLVAISIYAVVMSLNSKKTLALAGFVVGAATYIAVLSELKMYFIEIGVIIGLAMLLSKPTVKSISILVGSLVMLYVAIQIMGMIYPIFDGFFKIDTIVDYISNDNYGGESGNLNRTTALPYVFQNLLWTPYQKFFGMGMGNAGVDSYFYNEFGSTKYTWFFPSYFTAENGIVGLALYMLFMISVAFSSFRFMLRDVIKKEYYITIIILCAMMFIVMFYDGTLIVNTSYIYFVILSFPFVLNKSRHIELGELI